MFLRSRRPARLLRSDVLSRWVRPSSSLGTHTPRHPCVDVHPEVQDALAHHKPIVALETTIVTHGMPHPTNLETARSVESIVRKTGAIPATIGLIDGRVKIGLEPSELERLADVEKNPSAVKLSRRDIGPAIALGRDGGTTCSATLIFAALAGIRVFATGGLGGVHRGAESTMDISADLQELTRCPVGLVSAGVKSILDIGRTLEYLETLGVPVMTYGPTDDFPAFYSRRSGFKSPWRVEDPATAARVLDTHWQLGMSNGALFGAPIPEPYETVGEELQAAVEQAVRESEANGMSKRGKEATPWLLKRVGELSAGKSLASNIALIENTAHIGGQIACAYAELVSERNGATQASHTQPSALFSKDASRNKPTKEENPTTPGKLVVVGSAAVDITARADPIPGAAGSNAALHSTAPGVVSITPGGVGRNVAEAAHRVLSAISPEESTSTVLVSPIGTDAFGDLLESQMKTRSMRTDGFVRMADARSAVCNMVLDSTGGLTGGVADMDITRLLDGPKAIGVLEQHEPVIVAFDANLSQDTLKSLVLHCQSHNISTFFEPTSVPKSTVVFPALAAVLNKASIIRAPITFATPNLLELAQMYQEACAGPLELTSHKYWWDVVDRMGLDTEYRNALEQLSRRSAFDDEGSGRGTLSFLVENGVAQMAVNLLPFFQHIVIKCGDRGLITVFRTSGEQASAWLNEYTNVYSRQVVARSKDNESVVVLKHFPALQVPTEKIVNVTGAGDSLVGAMLAVLTRTPSAFEDPATLDKLVGHAQMAAVYTLQSEHAVSPRLSTMAPL